MATESLPNVVRFPRSKKRGAKVRRGPCAIVIPLHQDSVAHRYAAFKTISFNEDEYEEAFAEHLQTGERFIANGLLDAASLREMIQRERECLLLKLERIAEV